MRLKETAGVWSGSGHGTKAGPARFIQITTGVQEDIKGGLMIVISPPLQIFETQLCICRFGHHAACNCQC